MKKIFLVILLLTSFFVKAQPTANAGIDQTIILPINYCQLYAGFPYSVKSSASAISSFVWTQVSGPNTAVLSRRLDIVQAISSLDSAIYVRGLIQGTYQFRVNVTDANGSRADTVQVIVQPAPALNTNTKSITLTNGVYYPNNAQSALNINPGDTIFLDGNLLDSTDAIILGNIHGTAAQPIYVMPKNAPVKIARVDFGNEGWGSGGDIRFSYIIVDGRLNGVPHRLNSKQFLFYTGHHVELAYCRSDYSFQSAIHLAGYTYSGDHRFRFPAMFRVGFYIHDNIVDQPAYEGLYGGPTSLTNQGWDGFKYQPRGDSLFVYNNVVTNTGNDGIQIGGFNRAIVINNSTRNNGVNGSGGQGSGINFGTMVTGSVIGNLMIKPWRNGSFVNGYGNILFKGNWYDSAGFYEPNPGNAIIYINSSQHNPERTPPMQVTVDSNFFRNPYPNLLTVLSAVNYGDASSIADSNFIFRQNGGNNFYFFDDPGFLARGNQSVGSISFPTFPLNPITGPTLLNPNQGFGLSPSNIAPTANAGVDQSITLPTSSIVLSGSGNDSDGTITTYLWEKVSGGTATIVTPSSATTSVTGLIQGTYVFRLTVTDNGFLTGTDNITITVNPEPAPPPSQSSGKIKFRVQNN